MPGVTGTNSIGGNPPRVAQAVDVATATASRPLRWALLLLLVGAAWTTGAVFAWLEGAWVGVVILGILAYGCLVMGIGRARMAFDRDWCLRAGPLGLTFRAPTFGLSTLRGSYGIKAQELLWEDIKSCEPYPERGGLTDSWLSTWIERSTVSALRIEPAQGPEILISTAPFLESQYQIADNIKQIRGART